MRKVTEQVMTAFINGERKSVGNTMTDGERVWLHGNEIAYRDQKDRVWVSLAGWPTPTTRERLNGLATLLNGRLSFYQRNRTAYVCNPLGEAEADIDAWYCLPH